MSGLPTAPIVLVVVGTDHHPFDRLCQWVDRWAAAHPEADCFIQCGTASPPTHAGWARGLDYDEVGRRMAAADVVVCHGGPGTIMDCRQAGRLPIVVPRRRDLGEHVDDHQLRFARRFADTGAIRLAETEDELYRLLAAALAEPASVAVDEAAGGTVAARRFGELLAELGPRPTRWRRAALS